MTEPNLFALFRASADVTRGGAVLSQAVHTLTVHQLDGADQTGAGAAVVLVAARVAKVYMGADETLLVAQQDHNLRPETKRGKVSVKERNETVYTVAAPTCPWVGLGFKPQPVTDVH